MTLSKPIRWLLALTAAVAVWGALIDQSQQTPHKSPALDVAPPGRQGVVARIPQAAVWPLMDTTPSNSWTPWPAMDEGSRLAWQAPPPPIPPRARPKPAVTPQTSPAVLDTTPVAPRFPYKLIGQLEDADQRAALLTDSRGTFPVVRNQVIDRNWKVIAVTDTGFEVTWLPNGQSLSISY